MKGFFQFFKRYHRKEGSIKLIIATIAYYLYGRVLYAFLQSHPLHSDVEINKKGIDFLIFGSYDLIMGLGSILYLKKKLSDAQYQNIIYFSAGSLISHSIELINHIDYPMLAHHVAFLLILIFYPYYNFSTHVVARGLLAELAVPFLYYGLYLKEIGHDLHPTFLPIVFISLLSYGVLRVINFTLITWALAKSPYKWTALTAFSPLLLLNYYWFFKMIRGIIIKFFL